MARSTSALAFAGVPRVNLLPRVEVERRQRNALTVKWMWGLLAAVLVVGLVAAGAYSLKWTAERSLEAEQATTTTLLGQLDDLSDVSAELHTQSDLREFLSSAMGSDLEWSRTVSSAIAVLPASVRLTAFDLTSGGAPAGGEAADGAIGLTGTVTFEGPTPIGIADTIRAVRAVPGVLDADGTEVSRVAAGGEDEAVRYTYQLTITFDQSVYSGAFAKEAN